MQNIIISRTDNLGDVVLTLPLAGFLKKRFPGSTIYFIGKEYTLPIINASIYIDHFIDRDAVLQDIEVLKSIKAETIIFVYPDKELARAAYKAKIKKRIGTSHRYFHWLYCNQLIPFSRKKSELHECLLNFKLLKAFSFEDLPTLKDIPSLYGMLQVQPLPQHFRGYLHHDKINIILHPKSKGSAREWPLNNFIQLITLLDKEKYHFNITGTEAEGKTIRSQAPEIFQLNNVSDVTGILNLNELISFISLSDGLVACSTGPLHIAAALGIFTYGIYPSIKPMHAQRWGAVGSKTSLFFLQKNCTDCRYSSQCACVESISPNEIAATMKKDHE